MIPFSIIMYNPLMYRRFSEEDYKVCGGSLKTYIVLLESTVSIVCGELVVFRCLVLS